MTELAKSVLDRALEKGGIRYKCASHLDAKNLRQRCYNYRKTAQRQSKKLFDPGEPSYGASPYDNLHLSVDGQVLIISILTMPEELENGD